MVFYQSFYNLEKIVTEKVTRKKEPLITSDKSGELNYFPASSEFSHIVAELEKYIETPEESSLTFDFKVTNILTKKTVELAYWAYSYSQNCITIKLLNKDLKVYNNFFWNKFRRQFYFAG